MTKVKTRIKKITLVAVLLFLMVEIILIAPKEIGVPKKSDSPLLVHSETETAQQSMRGVHLTEAKGEGKDWELWADQAFTEESAKTWKLLNVKVTFFGESGMVYDVTGDTGHVNVETKDISIAGNVMMLSNNGYRFRTEQMFYNSVKRELNTDDPVTMNGGEGKGEHPVLLTGVGMVAHMSTNEMFINKDVRSKKQLESGEYVFIESDRAVFSSENKFAKYMGDVTIDYQGTRISGPNAQFDYDPKIKAVSRLTVEGGAKITDISKWATAKTLQMFFQEDKSVLSGSPRVVQDNDELVGEEITLLNGGKEIIVNRARAEFESRPGGK